MLITLKFLSLTFVVLLLLRVKINDNKQTNRYRNSPEFKIFYLIIEASGASFSNLSRRMRYR